ncbi:helix-turn-helix domain-containing protein [Streptomyces sp. Li-HN-5-11]|uniref:helix-turn-helix domain-containing protein n=1 Tax=Streptomyces sp. Li-HN-5-11 TaxID=3075432 RepID=UPI0037DA7876
MCDLAARTTARASRRQAPGRPLLDALWTWLTLHGSWDRTAAALRVHRHTVRHRLARSPNSSTSTCRTPASVYGLVAHAVEVHGEDPLHDGCGDGVGFEFVDELSGRGF